jgi:hypothetical protein
MYVKGGKMPGVIHQYLADDHDRLEGLLQQAVAMSGTITIEPFDRFREGLLRHIAMEEKVLLPTIARLQGGCAASAAERIRLDHGAIVALLVPTPSPSIVATLRSILEGHNVLEEKEGGVYRLAEELSGAEAEALLAQLTAVRAVPVRPYNTNPDVLEATRRAVVRAGYDMIEVR